MRMLSVVLAVLFLAGVGRAQTPKPSTPSRRPVSASKPVGDLAQVMRGILFPNSNLIFDAQANDPGAPKKVESGSGGGATASFSSVYSGWQVVENAAIAIAESADLIMKPGRVCSNGKSAPVARADYAKFAAGLRQAGVAALAAATTKSQEKVVEVTDKLAEACANCHEVYRDKGPAGSPARCTP